MRCDAFHFVFVPSFGSVRFAVAVEFCVMVRSIKEGANTSLFDSFVPDLFVKLNSEQKHKPAQKYTGLQRKVYHADDRTKAQIKIFEVDNTL